MTQQIEQPVRMREYTVLLRACAVPIRATDMLYVAAALLTPGKNAEQRTVNTALATMVAAMLDLPTTDPALVERVLRSLPDPERE